MPKLKLNPSVISVDAFEIFCANTKLIGPNGDIQLTIPQVEDLIVLLSSIVEE